MEDKTNTTKKENKPQVSKVPCVDCPFDICKGKLILLRETEMYNDYQCQACLTKFAMDKKGVGVKKDE